MLNATVLITCTGTAFHQIHSVCMKAGDFTMLDAMVDKAVTYETQRQWEWGAKQFKLQ